MVYIHILSIRVKKMCQKAGTVLFLRTTGRITTNLTHNLIDSYVDNYLYQFQHLNTDRKKCY